MYCIGTVVQLNYGYFDIQAVTIPLLKLPMFISLGKINPGSGQWQLLISLITILKLILIRN